MKPKLIFKGKPNPYAANGARTSEPFYYTIWYNGFILFNTTCTHRLFTWKKQGAIHVLGFRFLQLFMSGTAIQNELATDPKLYRKIPIWKQIKAWWKYERERSPWPRTVYVLWWSRDCDMNEGSSVDKYRSKRQAWKAYRLAQQWAEGPVTMEYISKEDFDNFKPYHRDRAMEAYENGRGTSIYV